MDNLFLYGVTGGLQFWAYAVLALPLISFLMNSLWLRKYPRAAGWSATILIGLAFVSAIAMAMGWRNEVLNRPELFPTGAALAFEHTWLNLVGLQLAAKFSFYLDSISVMMTLIVTGISFLVHCYSTGYMHGDRSEGRFFGLLSFFTFTMLGLISAHNVVQTFFFWELVGAASYLLIGFWYEKPEAVAASKKAFIITRFADGFFLAGILLVGLNGQSFDFSELNTLTTAEMLNHSVSFGGISINLLFATTLCLYAGAWGKSAMFPLHVWLPDAMEGPTPVSSLIHSATMVVAGVYLTARFFPLFSQCPPILHVVEVTGIVTALFAAIVACTQTDLKRILAFSTLSQLGYMMFALGLGGEGETSSLGFSASMFHVFTHAFFKCLLFLSAGVIIHAVHKQDLKEMGGLRSRMPWTYWLTLIACLAISGIWPFAGFFSKDEILLATLENGHYLTFVAALLTGGLTAFYMFRYFFLIFHGPAANSIEHKSGFLSEPGSMIFPMVVLAIPSVLAGLFRGVFLSIVRPIPAPAELDIPSPEGFHWLPWLALFVAIAGISYAFYKYIIKRRFYIETHPTSKAFQIVEKKFYLDEAWGYFGRTIGLGYLSQPLEFLERVLINGTFNIITGMLRVGSVFLTWAQNGRLQFYSGTALLGICLLYWFGVKLP